MQRRIFLENVLKLGASIPFFSLATANMLFAKKFEDYKAIVILELDGGNDSFNTFIPMEATSYAEYKKSRNDIAINNDIDLFYDNKFKYVNSNASNYLDLSGGNPYDDGTSDISNQYKKGVYLVSDKDDNSKQFGINAMMPEFADLFKKGKISLASNIGTLVEATTKDKIKNKTAKLPLFLYAHDHQRRAIYTAQSDKIINNGFAGRLGDRWKGMNGDIGLGISYAGMNQVLIGRNSAPLVLRGAPESYKTHAKNINIETFLASIAKNKNDNLFQSYYKTMQNKSSMLSSTLKTSWENVPIFNSKNSYGEGLFTATNPSRLNLNINQLDEGILLDMKNLAKMIKISKNDLKLNRQIFVIKMGGFDFHSSQIQEQSKKLRSLSLALSDFYKALEEINMQENVVLCSLSDFGRTILANSDGTDHGWGGHNFIMSGNKNFQGGKILGKMIESFALNSENVVSKKGRIIPSTSIEQFMSPIFDWFGANEEEIQNSFPNLINFRAISDNYKSAFLDGMFRG